MHPTTPRMIEDAVRTLIVTTGAPRADILLTTGFGEHPAQLQLHLPDCALVHDGNAYDDPHPLPAMLRSFANATMRTVADGRTRELRAENSELHVARHARSQHPPGTHLEVTLPHIENIDAAVDACVAAVVRQPPVIEAASVRINGTSIAEMTECEASGRSPIDRASHAWLEQLATTADPDPMPPRPLAALHEVIEQEQRRGCPAFGAHRTDLIRHQLVLLAGNGPDSRALACHHADDRHLVERCAFIDACLSPEPARYVPEPEPIGVHTAQRLIDKTNAGPIPSIDTVPRDALRALLEHEARCARRTRDANRACAFEHPDGILGPHPHTPPPVTVAAHAHRRGPRTLTRTGKQLVRAIASVFGLEHDTGPAREDPEHARAISLRLTVDANSAVRGRHSATYRPRHARLAHTRRR